MPGSADFRASGRVGLLLGLVAAGWVAPAAAAPLGLGVDPAFETVVEGPSARHGAGLGLRVHAELTASFSLGGRVTYAAHAGDGGTLHAGLVVASLLYKFDVVQWIPFVGLDLGVLWLSGGGASARATLAMGFGLGLDYLLSRDWAVGFAARYLLAPAERSATPGALLVGPRLTFRWE